MAKVVKLELGNGEARYVVDYFDLTGRRRKERFKRERDARLRLGEVMSQRETGELRARADDIRFRALVDDWRLAHWANIRKNSQQVYGRMLDNHLIPLLGDRKLRTITLRDCEQLVAKVEEKFVKASLDENARASTGRATANMALTVLKLVLGYARKHRYVSDNVARDAKPRPEPATSADQQDEQVFTPAELRRLWDAAEPGLWRTFLMTVSLTGLRKGEAMGLKWSDVDWASSTLYVRRQIQNGEFTKPKTDAGRRTIAMRRALVLALKEWKLAAPKGPLDLVFPNATGGMMSEHAPDKFGLHPALRRAGLRAVTLHWLRHGYGSICVSEGTSLKVVQVSMGHSSIKMTMDVYGHLLPGDLETTVAALDRAFARADVTDACHFFGNSDEKSPETRAASEDVG